MADKSKIEWTEATWNPVTGCSKVSAGCNNCYSERLALRLQAMSNTRYRNGFRITIHPDIIELPKHWRAPRLIFVNSMSDLFHEKVPFFFKQWGGVRKDLTGRRLNGRIYNEIPAQPFATSRDVQIELVHA